MHPLPYTRLLSHYDLVIFGSQEPVRLLTNSSTTVSAVYISNTISLHLSDPSQALVASTTYPASLHDLEFEYFEITSDSKGAMEGRLQY